MTEVLRINDQIKNLEIQERNNLISQLAYASRLLDKKIGEAQEHLDNLEDLNADIRLSDSLYPEDLSNLLSRVNDAIYSSSSTVINGGAILSSSIAANKISVSR